MIRVQILHCGFLKVSAEEMFNHFPSDKISACYNLDKEGYLKIAMNALLIAEGEQVVIIDPGCADFLPSRLEGAYGLEIPETLEEVLGNAGFNPQQVTDVVFTHLHFDHGSGAFSRVPGKIRKRFTEAKYHVLKEHFEYASRPDSKESNSFFTTFFRYVDKIHWLENWEHGWMEFQVYNGHTRGMVVPKILSSEMDTYFVTDLMPMELFMEPDVNSGYDLDPELAIGEKLDFLNAIEKPSELIFFHDPLKERKFYP
ncbi:MAG: MBL fold metallo-hydrolase [Bacteroidales bacterium]|nr:MBL fold metallo-hydrolase [Bacteroidales bacterium]